MTIRFNTEQTYRCCRSDNRVLSGSVERLQQDRQGLACIGMEQVLQMIHVPISGIVVLSDLQLAV